MAAAAGSPLVAPAGRHAPLPDADWGEEEERGAANHCTKARNWTGFGCLAVGGLAVLPLGLRFGYGVVSTLAPIPLAIINAVGYVFSKTVGSVISYGISDYGPAILRASSGKELQAGDVGALIVGTAMAVSAMVMGCFCFRRNPHE